jgi:DNA-binding MarR family transcriptional regulator
MNDELQDDIIDRLGAEWKPQRPELDVDAMQVVGRALSLGKRLEKRASTALNTFGIHYTDLDVLATLRRSGAPYSLSPKALMASVLITSGAMTALLDRLTKLGLIIREPDLSDGRIKRATLSPKGITLIDKAIQVRFEEAQASVTGLSAEEQQQLSALLKKWMASLDV